MYILFQVVEDGSDHSERDGGKESHGKQGKKAGLLVVMVAVSVMVLINMLFH
jgi:hypothetical protein